MYKTLIFFPFFYTIVILDKCHWMLYLLTPAMYPRFLITLDEKLENYPVTVRVGQVSFFSCSLISGVLTCFLRIGH